MEIRCRLASLEDCEFMARIAHEHEPRSIESYIESIHKQVEGASDKESITKIFVAEVDGEIAGHGKLLFYNSKNLDVKFKSPEGWYFNGVIVSPKFRRLGIARRLSEIRENFIKNDERGNDEAFSIVSAANIPSIEYHKSVGFKEFQRAPGYLNIQLECGEGILFRKVIK